MIIILKAKEASALGLGQQETKLNVPMKVTQDGQGISALGGRVIYPVEGIRMGGLWIKKGDAASGGSTKAL